MAYKVIILYNKIFHYRIPVWNELAKKCDLTVTYSEGDGKVPDNMEVNFKIMQLPARSIKGIVLQKANIRKLCRQYDAVIAYGNIAWLKYSTSANTPSIVIIALMFSQLCLFKHFQTDRGTGKHSPCIDG